MRWNILIVIAVASLLLSPGMAEIQAQSPPPLPAANAPVRLGLICESDEASAASDLLTVMLSSKKNLQLLERNEINKVYREQGLSAANKDYLKLGQMLGADGLLLLNINKTQRATNLTLRLIAVKPGVVLKDESFDWPVKDLAPWAESLAKFLPAFFPKLTVLVKDAIPISVVNLRSAAQTADALEVELQLKLLTIQRLSQERQIFVLERQRMQMLSEEKELKLDDAAFWNGSYLLEGVADQSGYTKDVLTINARLTPPKGGSPLLIEVKGSRTNVADVVNQLATQVVKLLKINSTAKDWNAADEAAQYYDEAIWALKWGVIPEAQAAADSAWALGKRDLDCATARVRAYMSAAEIGNYQTGDFGNPRDAQEVIQYVTEGAAPQRPWGLTLKETDRNGMKDFHYVFVRNFPDAVNIGIAAHALEIYYDFSRTLPAEEPKVNSPWYRLGVNNLTVASQVLQHFHFVAESQPDNAGQLAHLRWLARSVAKWISQSPSVRDSYFLGARYVSYDDLYHFMETPSIFSCEVGWECFWQEKPEDCVGLYRHLMSSPVFRYIHEGLWLRDLQKPRLTGWNEQDRKRIPAVWEDFKHELGNSSNLLLQLEVKALQLTDARNTKELTAAFTNLFDTLVGNHDLLVSNPVDVLYLQWGTGGLVENSGAGMVTPATDAMQNRYRTEYYPKLEAMHEEYSRKTLTAGKFLMAFEKQKQFLKAGKLYDIGELAQLFAMPNYSRAQALELLPLLAAYKSNLVAQAEGLSGLEKVKKRSGIQMISMKETEVNRLLNPPASKPALATAPSLNNAPASVTLPVAAPKTGAAAGEMVTNVLGVKNYAPIPQDMLKTKRPQERLSNLTISTPRFNRGKLWFDLRYHEEYLTEDNGLVNFACLTVAFFNPQDQRWELIPSPGPRTAAYLVKPEFTEILGDNLFISGPDYLRWYDLKAGRWETVSVPWQQTPELFAVSQRLFAANEEAIFEILPGGQSIKILASTRRRPAASALDLLDRLGNAKLFEGPQHSICASVGGKVFSWSQNDWQEILSLNISQPPELFDDALIFRFNQSAAYRQPGILWLWNKSLAAPEVALYQKLAPSPYIRFRPRQTGDSPNPVWKSEQNNALMDSSAAFFRSNLYFVVEQDVVNTLDGQGTKMAKGDYDAMLVCLSHDLSEPVMVPLKFDLQHGPPPLKSLNMKPEEMRFAWNTSLPWLSFSSEALYFGQANTPGIWAIPISEVESALAAEKQRMLARQQSVLAKKAQEDEAARQLKKRLLEQYDQNHNGVLDPEEKENALSDPVFIQSELEVIDANHNGWLDLPELAYFDANGDKTLQTNEQAAIEVAQGLLSAILLKKFDLNGDSRLDEQEFRDLLHSIWGDNFFAPSQFMVLDKNHDRQLDLAELESLWKGKTLGALGFYRGAPARLNRIPTDASNPIDPQQLFKTYVEAYWQNPGGISNRPPTRIMPPAGSAPAAENKTTNLNQHHP